MSRLTMFVSYFIPIVLLFALLAMNRLQREFKLRPSHSGFRKLDKKETSRRGLAAVIVEHTSEGDTMKEGDR